MSERKREFEEEKGEASSTNVSSPLKTTKLDDSESASDSNDVVLRGSSASLFVSLADLASNESPDTSTGEENEHSSSIRPPCFKFSSESAEIAKNCSKFTVDLQVHQISVNKTEKTSTKYTIVSKEKIQVSEEGFGETGTETESSSATERREVKKTPVTPPPEEIESFFSEIKVEDKQNQFMQKYNFDFVNDKPLEGRYKWDRLKP